MARVDISLIIYNSNKQALLHVRDSTPGINHPNKIGLFGGHVEKDETLEQALERETAEELNGYELKNAQYLGQFDVGYELHVYVKYEPDLKLTDYVVTEGQTAIFADRGDLAFLDTPELIVPVLEKFFDYVQK